MQDRFKFRVFLKYNQIMCDIDSYCFLQGINKCVFHFTNGSQKTLKNDDFILMQCTGLKDKNGKLIYEGDIVKTIYTKPDGVIINRNCVIEYNRSAFWINYGIAASYLYNDDCIYEVIGNRYENPKLLEVE